MVGCAGWYVEIEAVGPGLLFVKVTAEPSKRTLVRKDD
jgi:hypothetical protein